MQFQDTRLHELGRWIVAIVVGVAILILANQLFPILRHDAALMEKEHELSNQIEPLKQEIDSFTPEQRDRFIALQQEYAKIIGREHYEKRVRNLYLFLSILALVLLGLSVIIKQSTPRLITAVTGALAIMSVIFFQAFGREDIKLVLIFLIIFGLCASIWHYFLKNRVNQERYIALQVLAVVSLALALTSSAAAVYRYFINSIYQEIPAIVQLQDKWNHNVQEQQTLLRKSVLTEPEKQRYIDLVKENSGMLPALHELSSSEESRQVVQAYTVAMEKARPYIIILQILFASLWLALGIVIMKPMYLSFGLIFGGLAILLNLIGLGFVDFWMYVVITAMAAVTAYFLYHQPRQTM